MASLRFLCAEYRVPTHYATDKDGVVKIIPEAFGDQPPSHLILNAGENSKNRTPGKQSSEAKPENKLAWRAGRVTSEIKLPADAIKGKTITISIEDRAATSSEKKAPREPALVPVASIPTPKPGRPQLVALYQPDISGKWLPIKALSLDISPENFPVGTCALLNLSNFPAHVLLGEQGTPLSIAPGIAKIISPPPRNPDGSLLVRVAVATGDGGKILSNTLRTMPKDTRQLLIIGATHPILGGGLPAYVNIKPLE